MTQAKWLVINDNNLTPLILLYELEAIMILYRKMTSVTISYCVSVLIIS